MYETATSSAMVLNQANFLIQLSEKNIDRVDMWFSWMLDISMLVLAIIAVMLVLVGWVTYKNYSQLKKTSKLLDEVENKKKEIFNDAGEYIAKFAQQQKGTKEGAIKAEDLETKALNSRAFGPVLFKSPESNTVYAIDERGYLHGIPNPPTLFKMGYNWSDVKRISTKQLSEMKRGESIPDLSQTINQ